MKKITFLICSLTVIAAILHFQGCSALKQSTSEDSGNQAEPQQSDVVENLQINVECSDSIHKGLAIISWEPGKNRLQKPQLEVTVFKNGFRTGQFKLAYPIEKNQIFLQNPDDKYYNQTRQSIPDLYVRDIRKDKSGRITILEIDGLEAGLNYFWRIRFHDKDLTSSRVIRCQGPICPVDIIDQKE